MNIIVHLKCEGTGPVICDPFCGSDCLSLSVPVIFVVVSCVPLGPRVCRAYWYVSDACSECGNEL